jgi:hypothetical protein
MRPAFAAPPPQHGHQQTPTPSPPPPLPTTASEPLRPPPWSSSGMYMISVPELAASDVQAGSPQLPPAPSLGHGVPPVPGGASTSAAAAAGAAPPPPLPFEPLGLLPGPTAMAGSGHPDDFAFTPPRHASPRAAPEAGVAVANHPDTAAAGSLSLLLPLFAPPVSPAPVASPAAAGAGDQEMDEVGEEQEEEADGPTGDDEDRDQSGPEDAAAQETSSRTGRQRRKTGASSSTSAFKGAGRA